MKTPFISIMAAISLLSYVASTIADNELVVNVYKNESVAAGLSASLDGSQSKALDESSTAWFDMRAGSHSLRILDGDTLIHRFKFNTAAGQYADIKVSLEDGKKPVVSIDSYFKKETPLQRSKAVKGRLSGKVTSNGLPVMDADVVVSGLKLSTQTDEKGNYSLELPRGVYTLKISHPDMGEKEITDFRIVGGISKASNFSISQMSASAGIEEVVVLAKINTSGLQESERYSVNVIDTLGVEELSRFGDSDVASAVVRVPSVTVEDSRYVFIRGLGGRYITTTLNGATLPSTDPAKRTVPLDLFPSNMVSQLDVKKTFIPSMPGESTGGNLVINTRTFPNEKAGKISFSMGYVSGLTDDDALVDPQSGGWDDFGWDDGTREEDVMVKAIAKALERSNLVYLSDAAEQELRRTSALMIKDDLDIETQKARPNISIGANYGDVFSLDSSDSELGFFAAVNYKNGWSYKNSGISRSYSVDGSDILDDFSYEEYSNNIDINGLLSLGFIQGDNTYSSNTIISRVTESRVDQFRGRDGDSAFESIQHNIDWEERQFISQQFLGEHFLDDEGNFTSNWQLTLSQATRLAPDRREVRFDLEGNDNIYNLVVPNVLRRFEDLVDNNIDLSTDFKYMLDASGDSESSISFGLQAISRERDSDSSTYGFIGSLLTVDDNAPNLLVSDVITTDNITGDQSTGIAFTEKTLPSDSYESEMDLNAVYFMYDNLFLSEYQVIAGFRYEDFLLNTETFSLQESIGTIVPSAIDESIVLPSLSFNWYMQEDQQLRFAITKTVSRPDFKESSNAVFYDTEIRKRIRGNPNLKVSEIINFDVRWERYWSDTENLSVALFYKDFKDPIERVVLTASGTASDSRTFQNSPAATLYGIELDGRKDIALNESMTKSLFVAVNASYIDSEVDLENEKKRQLQGQPEYTFNFILGYDDIVNNQELTLLINKNGENIEDVGVATRANVIQEPSLNVNITYQYYFDEDVVIKVKISNLLDSKVEFTQGGKVLESRKEGIEFQAGIEWSF